METVNLSKMLNLMLKMLEAQALLSAVQKFILKHALKMNIKVILLH